MTTHFIPHPAPRDPARLMRGSNRNGATTEATTGGRRLKQGTCRDRFLLRSGR
ncbi:hypothetical protein [Acetobacter sp.]|uniref:hypothetical protein n=1 Tax=Acetobacter sp. TaxID=440 RepID=UPI0039E7F1A9